MHPRSLPLALLAAACLVASSCGRSGPGADDGAARRPVIVTTVAMVTDIVKEVAGDGYEVVGLVGAGVDPHLYKPTRDDVRAISGAHTVFYVGLNLEGKMADVLASAPGGAHAVTRVIPEDMLLTDEESGHPDPHVWMDATLWARCAEGVGEAFAKMDPADAGAYRERAAAVAAKCLAIHNYGVRTLATVPRPARLLVTSHDAFRYFGGAYDVEVLGVQGISTESEAGLQRVNQLVDTLVERRVKAVFVESSVPRKAIEAIVEGVRAKGGEITVGGELYSDAMGASGTYEGTYVGMMDHNITTVARALGGDAPERGANGKLAGSAPHTATGGPGGN
ncbi:MAG TPA: zinc ABC transporter substrate-binding protein [Phycisphaerales bacterium]|nr:zinc ABC transporter substrate-binding protein [Phycisphaerales bacterium]